MRGGEVDGIDRHFVDREEFERRRRDGRIVADYVAFGERYGFCPEIREAVMNGATIVEQTVPFTGFKKAVNEFFDLPMKKILVLADLEDIALRMREGRSAEDFERRFEENRGYIREHIMNIKEYDEVKFAYPSRLFKDQIDLLKDAIRSRPEEWKKTGYYDFSLLTDPWMLDRLTTLRANPWFYNHLKMIALFTVKDGYPQKNPSLMDWRSETDMIRGGGNRTIDEHYMANIFAFNAVLANMKFNTEHWIDYAVNAIQELPRRDPALEKNPILRPVLEHINDTLTSIFTPAVDGQTPHAAQTIRAWCATYLLGDMSFLVNYKDSQQEGVQAFEPRLLAMYEQIILGFRSKVARANSIQNDKIFKGLGEEERPIHEEDRKDMDFIGWHGQQKIEKIFSLAPNQPLPIEHLNHAKIMVNSAPLQVDSLANELQHYVFTHAASFPEQNEYIHTTLVPLIGNYMKKVALQTPLQHPVQKYLLSTLADFVDNLFAVSVADRSKPNSLTNMTMYPVLTSKEQFIRTYLSRRVPTERESKQRIMEKLPLLYEATR